MKYIKKFEINKVQPKPYDFQKYLIFKWDEENDDIIVILEYDSIDYRNDQIETHIFIVMKMVF